MIEQITTNGVFRNQWADVSISVFYNKKWCI